MPVDRKLGCLSVFLAVALCGSIFFNLVLAAAAFRNFGSSSRYEEQPPSFREVIVQRGSRGTGDKIAVIMMRGLISSSLPGNVGETMVDDMRLALQQARDDDRVRAVVLEIDSPGGEVTASDIIYNWVVKTRSKKPVIVYMDSLAASGGYYVACGGKYLMANETTITGSIGVIIQTLNYEQLFNKVGLASVVFKSGKFKDMLNGARQVTPEERDMIQGFVMKTYEKFLGVVARERNLPADALRNSIADGRILSGKDALENKLIDGTGQIEDAFAKAKELGRAPGA
ncbi:MAG TPA: signal peptide peptidase SppA, partial [Chthoniobacterales bacterium]|nr:signal peptide peptidase SppA [Chthoniobacterales bacterium]